MKTKDLDIEIYFKFISNILITLSMKIYHRLVSFLKK